MAIVRGELVAFDDGTWTAEIRIDGSPGSSVTGVRVALGGDDTDWTAGKKVVVETGEANDPNDLVILAIYAQ